jgi:hypothetical protein
LPEEGIPAGRIRACRMPAGAGRAAQAGSPAFHGYPPRALP